MTATRRHTESGRGTKKVSICVTAPNGGPAPGVSSQGDLNSEGVVNVVDEAIFRRMLAGLPVWLS